MPQQPLTWWTEDASRLKNAGRPEVWGQAGVTDPMLLQVFPIWADKVLGPLSGVANPEERRNLLVSRLKELSQDPASEVNRFYAQKFLQAFPMEDTALSTGLLRGLTEGVTGGLPSEILRVPKPPPGDPVLLGMDKGTLARIAGNIGGMGALGMGASALGVGGPLALAGLFAAHGLSQAMGMHLEGERQKEAQRQLFRASGQEPPAVTKATPWGSLPSVVNMGVQSGLSAASAGLAGKVAPLLKAGKEIPGALKAAYTAMPSVEAIGSTLAQLWDSYSGDPKEVASPEGLKAMAPFLAFGAGSSALRGRQMGKYQPQPVPAPTPTPSPTLPITGGQPVSATYPPMHLNNPEAIRAGYIQSLANQAPGQFGQFYNLLNDRSQGHPSGLEILYRGAGSTGDPFKLVGRFSDEALQQKGLAQAMSTYALQQPGSSTGMAYVPEGRLRESFIPGFRLPGGQMIPMPHGDYDVFPQGRDIQIKGLGPAVAFGEPRVKGQDPWFALREDPPGQWNPLLIRPDAVEAQALSQALQPPQMAPPVQQRMPTAVHFDPSKIDESVEALIKALGAKGTYQPPVPPLAPVGPNQLLLPFPGRRRP